MKNYELTVIFHPDLEMNIDPAIEKVKKILESAGGNIIKEENEGKKRLSYPIKGHEYGIYNYIVVALPPQAPAKIDGTLNITDEVIRYLLVKEDPRKSSVTSTPEADTPQDEDPTNQAKITEEKGE